MSKSGYNGPQRRRISRRSIAFTLIFISIVVLLADRQQRSMLASGRLTTDNISSKIIGFIATPIRGLESLFVEAGNRKNAYKENVKLKAEIERLKNIENTVFDLQLRIKRFEEMLDIESSSYLPETKFIARTVSESKGPFVHSALIDIGINKDIKVGYSVMTTEGLYGHIIQTGSVSARVLLLNDLNSRISVMSQRSRGRAILVGNNTKSPKLSYVSNEIDWREGDRVITSGDGGVLPSGLPIGTISLNKNGNREVDLFYLKEPVDWVWVYPFTPIPAPENSLPENANAQGDVTPDNIVQKATE